MSQDLAGLVVMKKSEPDLVHANLGFVSVDDRSAELEQSVQKGAAVIHLVHHEPAMNQSATRFGGRQPFRVVTFLIGDEHREGSSFTRDVPAHAFKRQITLSCRSSADAPIENHDAGGIPASRCFGDEGPERFQWWSSAQNVLNADVKFIEVVFSELEYFRSSDTRVDVEFAEVVAGF